MDSKMLFEIACISGVIYFYFSFGNEILQKVKRHIKTKKIKTKIVKVEIYDKHFIEGIGAQSYGVKGRFRHHDSYLIDFEYEDKGYTVNDKEIFNTYGIGDEIELEFIQYLDKNNNVIHHKFKK